MSRETTSSFTVIMAGGDGRWKTLCFCVEQTPPMLMLVADRKFHWREGSINNSSSTSSAWSCKGWKIHRCAAGDCVPRFTRAWPWLRVQLHRHRPAVPLQGGGDRSRLTEFDRFALCDGDRRGHTNGYGCFLRPQTHNFGVRRLDTDLAGDGTVRARFLAVDTTKQQTHRPGAPSRVMREPTGSRALSVVRRQLVFSGAPGKLCRHQQAFVARTYVSPKPADN
jgi:hypothetical protein